MSKHVAEALIPILDAEAISNAICIRSREYCQSISISGENKRLDFGDGSAILKPSGEGLLLQVAANDLVTFYGIRTFLQGFLFSTTTIPGDVVEWQSGSGTLLGAVPRIGYGRSCSNGK